MGMREVAWSCRRVSVAVDRLGDSVAVTEAIVRGAAELLHSPISGPRRFLCLEGLEADPNWASIRMALIRIAHYLDQNRPPIDYCRRATSTTRSCCPTISGHASLATPQHQANIPHEHGPSDGISSKHSADCQPRSAPLRRMVTAGQ